MNVYDDYNKYIIENEELLSNLKSTNSSVMYCLMDVLEVLDYVYKKYIDNVKIEAELEEIATYAGEYGSYVDPNDPDNPVAYKDRTWTLVDNGGWHLGQLDDNARIKDQYDRIISISMLYKALQEEGMSKAEAKEWIANLQKELGI